MYNQRYEAIWERGETMIKFEGLPLAIVAMALAESIDFMMSATLMHTPPFMIARYLVKILVALIILARPNAFRALLSHKMFPSLLAVSGCGGALLLFLASGTFTVMVGTVLVSASETCLFVGQALVLFLAARRDVLKAAMTGVLLAFGIAVVMFALPEELSLPLQFIAIGSLSALVHKTASSHDLAFPAPKSTSASLIPGSLAIVLILFSFSTQFAYIFGSIDSDWAMVYAIGALASTGIMLLEFRVFSSSKISTLDITCALFIAVPVLLVGAGHVSNGTFMSLVNVGDCLFVPRMLQVILRSSEEDSTDPLKGVCLAHVLVTASVMLATLLGLSGIFESNGGMLKTAISIAAAVGCIFSAFILYSGRVQDDAFEYVRANERAEAHAAHAEAAESSKSPISLDVLRRVADELHLTRRETEVLALLAGEHELDEIGKELCISMSTVKTHVLHIYQKFGVHSRRELIEAVNRDSSCQR